MYNSNDYWCIVEIYWFFDLSFPLYRHIYYTSHGDLIYSIHSLCVHT